MIELESLSKFLKGIVQKHKRDRYANYLSSEKGKRRLLTALAHELERDLEAKRVTSSFSECEWAKPALLMSSLGAFGQGYSSLRAAYDDAPWEGGWLLVSAAGTYGIYRPEGRSDNEVLVKLQKPRAHPFSSEQCKTA